MPTMDNHKNLHLKPLAQNERLALVRELPQPLDEDLGASIDVLFALQHVGQGIYVVEDAPALRVRLVVDLGEGVAVLAEVLTVPGGVEVGLVEGALRAVDGLDGVGIRAGDLVRGDSNQGAVFLVKCSLGHFHRGRWRQYGVMISM